MCLYTKNEPYRTRSSFWLAEREGFASEIYFRVSFEASRDKSPRSWVEKALCLLQKRKERAITGSFFFFAEREGFEPPEPLSSTVFKTAAIDHSAISPSSQLACKKKLALRVWFATIAPLNSGSRSPRYIFEL